jgi:hypothetical protein
VHRVSVYIPAYNAGEFIVLRYAGVSPVRHDRNSGRAGSVKQGNEVRRERNPGLRVHEG